MIEKIKQKIEDNKVYIIATLFGVSALGAFFYGKSKSTKGKENLETANKENSLESSTKDLQDTQIVQFNQSNEEKALVRVITRLKKSILEQGFSYQVVKEIYKSQYQLSRQQFKNAILANRKQRRNLLDNIVEYEKVFIEYDTEIQEIHNKHLNAVLAHFRIEKGTWMQLIESASMHDSQDWSELLLSTEEQELESIRVSNKPKLKLSILLDIQKYRLKILKQKMAEFKKQFPLLHKSDLYNMVEKWAFDNIYMKFHVEEQDINYYRQQLSADEKQQLQQYQQDVRNLMGELIDDSPNSQSLQNSNIQEESRLIS